MVFSILVFFGFQALSPSEAFTLEATVKVAPQTINLDRQGKWISVFITLPSGYNVSDIVTSTILLEGQFSPVWSNVENNTLMVKFDSALVTSSLWMDLYHMGVSKTSVELKVTGQLNDGTGFSGSDTVIIMDTQN